MKIIDILMMPLLFIAMALLFSPNVLALDAVDQEFCNSNPELAICDTNDNQSATSNILVGPDGIITNVTQWMVYISGAVAMVLIIIAGFMFVFSQGRPESASRARSTVIYAIIGVVVAVVGQAIVTFVLERLG